MECERRIDSGNKSQHSINNYNNTNNNNNKKVKTLSQPLPSIHQSNNHYHSSLFAVKCLKNLYPSLSSVEELREIQALRRVCPHPNVIDLEEVLFDEENGRVALVFPLMKQNLYEFIKPKQTPLHSTLIASFAYQLISAIEHIHSKGVFHRDIKPENILINQQMQLKLADLGSCRGINSTPPYTDYISTRWYRPPECLLSNGWYDSAMDVWGVGCVLFEICTYQPLFPGKNEIDQLDKIHQILGTPPVEIIQQLAHKEKIINNNNSKHDKKTHHVPSDSSSNDSTSTSNRILPAFPFRRASGFAHLLPSSLTSPEFIDLLTRLLIYQPHKRFTARQALQHKYFHQFNHSANKMKRDSKQYNLSKSPSRLPSPHSNDTQLSSRTSTQSVPSLPKTISIETKLSPLQNETMLPTPAVTHSDHPKKQSKTEEHSSTHLLPSLITNNVIDKDHLMEEKREEKPTSNLLSLPNHGSIEELLLKQKDKAKHTHSYQTTQQEQLSNEQSPKHALHHQKKQKKKKQNYSYSPAGEEKQLFNSGYATEKAKVQDVTVSSAIEDERRETYSESNIPFNKTEGNQFNQKEEQSKKIHRKISRAQNLLRSPYNSYYSSSHFNTHSNPMQIPSHLKQQLVVRNREKHRESIHLPASLNPLPHYQSSFHPPALSPSQNYSTSSNYHKTHPLEEARKLVEQTVSLQKVNQLQHKRRYKQDSSSNPYLYQQQHQLNSTGGHSNNKARHLFLLPIEQSSNKHQHQHQHQHHQEQQNAYRTGEFKAPPLSMHFKR